MRAAAVLLAALTLPAPLDLKAQWEIQTSNTTASLRGIHALGNGIAWASGTEGTVLHTTDNGAHWQRCTTPPDADKLDFRGIQAFDANTAIVMSSGKGDLSRLYKTTDACQTWKLIFTNPEPGGFFDALQRETNDSANETYPDAALILGDSVDGKVQIWEWNEKGDYCDNASHDTTVERHGCPDDDAELNYETNGPAQPGEGSFAASNSVLQVVNTKQIDPSWKYKFRWASSTSSGVYMSMVLAETGKCEPCRLERRKIEIPMSDGTAQSGIFSFAFLTEFVGVAVGGDYERPGDRNKTAAFTTDGGKSWQPAITPPHGYRSAVAYSTPTKTWITVGPNGTDISTDDGRNWRALQPLPGEAPDADRNWNALSLPFVVGPHGRIGILNPAALKQPILQK